MSSSITSPNVEMLSEKIAELQNKLQQAAPGYESLLHTIHRQLSSDENLVHLLTEEQIGTLIVGLTRRKNIVLAEPDKKASGSTKSMSSSGKKLRDLSVEDLE